MSATNRLRGKGALSGCLWSVVGLLFVAGLAGAADPLPPGFVIVDYNVGVIHVDRTAGTVSPLAAVGGLLPCPVGVVVESPDSVLAATVCSPGVVRLRVTSGTQALVASGPLIPNPDGMALDAGKTTLYETDLTMGAVVAIDLVGGGIRVVKQGGLAAGSPFVVVGADSKLYLANRVSGVGRVVRMDPVSGQEEIVTSGGSLNDPKGIALAPSGDLIVVELGNRQIVRVNPISGTQSVVSSGGGLSAPYAIAVDNGNQAFVTNLFNGNIVKIDLASGQQSLIQVPGLTAAYGISIYGPPGSPAPGMSPPAPAPSLQFVKDVPHDQGGRVLVGWLASAIDAVPDDPIVSYTLWRRVTEGAAQDLLRRGARLLAARGDGVGTPDQPAVRVLQGPGGQTYWEFIASLPARGVAGYAYTAATTADSMPGYLPWNVFFVDAVDHAGRFYVSEPDSGYSVDNLTPAQPSPFVAEYRQAEVYLHWGANRESDLAGYRLYRGTTRGFVPSSGNLLIEKADTGYVDSRGTYSYYYKLSAVDAHANESLFALVEPSGPTAALASLVSAAYERGAVRLQWTAAANPGLTAELYRRTPEAAWQDLGPLTADGRGLLTYEDAAVEAGMQYGYRLGILDGDQEVFTPETWVSVPALQLALHGVRPNPTAGAGASVAFTLPSTGPASIEVFDVRGRLVQRQEVGALGPGYHEARLDSGAGMRAGVYLLRLRQGGQELKAKAVVLP